MTTEQISYYTSPAGKEFSFAAARFAGINPSSRILDMGCGYGESACCLASEFRCKITACDYSQENIDFARKYAIQRNVSHLIDLQVVDLLKADFHETRFELILAEGGVLSYLSRSKGLQLASSWLMPRGWFAFSDLIFLTDKIPDEIRKIYEDDIYHYESEQSYRKLIAESNLETHLLALVPSSGWDNYYAHVARRLEDKEGFFADRRIKLAFHKEIDAYYRYEGYRYVGYLFGIARRKA